MSNEFVREYAEFFTGKRPGIAPNNGTKPIGTPKTTAQCSIYQDGSTAGAGLAFLCSKVFPNGPVSNQIRGCLQSFYTPGSGYAPDPYPCANESIWIVLR